MKTSVQDLSNQFHNNFFEKVKDIRNEFAKHEIGDPELDEFFTTQEKFDQMNPRALILPQEIEEVATRLKALAQEIPKQP